MLCKAEHALRKDTFLKTCLALLGGLLRHMLLDQGSNHSDPSLTDYLFVLPKLISPKPFGKARWKNQGQKH